MKRFGFELWFWLMVIIPLIIAKMIHKEMRKGSVMNVIARKYFIWVVYDMVIPIASVFPDFSQKMLLDAIRMKFYEKV